MKDELCLEVEEEWVEEVEEMEAEETEKCITEPTKLDKDDEKSINAFYESTCCSLLCNTVITKDVAKQHRQRMQKFDKNELDLILSSTIHSHRRMEELKDVYYERAMRVPGSTPRKDFQSRNRIKYYFADLEVCKSFFLFVYDVGEKRFKNLVKHYRENGLVSRRHRLEGKSRSWGKIITPDDINQIVKFIMKYGDQHGMPFPGCLPKFLSFDVIKLPSNITKKLVWTDYRNTVDKKIDYTTFLKIWNKYCPYVTIMKPSSDLSEKLKKNSGVQQAKKSRVL